MKKKKNNTGNDLIVAGFGGANAFCKSALGHSFSAKVLWTRSSSVGAAGTDTSIPGGRLANDESYMFDGFGCGTAAEFTIGAYSYHYPSR